MLENIYEIKKITSSMIKYFQRQDDHEIASLLMKAFMSNEVSESRKKLKLKM